MDKRKLLPVGLVILLLIFWKYQTSTRADNFVSFSGTTMGPIVYNIKYHDNERRNYKEDIDSLLEAFNGSLSTYIPQSEISRFNANDSLVFETSFFYPVLNMSRQIYNQTNGAFDPTVGPLVAAWGFGSNAKRDPTGINVDSLKSLVGFDKLSFDKERIMKPEPGMRLDLSAVAKGYAVDLVGNFLEAHDLDNYMVEIGGEVRCRGRNAEGKAWRIGIENPDVEVTERELFATVAISDRSLATSGNYRNFYEVDGKKYSHTISPFTGYPVEHSLLSVSVFADNCMVADAFATGFLVLGLEKAVEIVNKLDSIDAYFIYADEEGILQTLSTEGVRKKIKE